MRPFTVIAAVLLAVTASAHLCRLVFGWVVTVNGLTVPMWVSVVGLVVPAAVAVMLWREARGN